MDAEAFSESLAYPQVKKRAVASRSFRTKISPSNGGSFVSGSTINIDLPGNLAGQYYNPNQMYLKFSVTGAAAYTLDRGGATGFIKRIQIQTAGAQLFDLNNWNVLACALLDTDSSSEWKASSGNIMLGTLGDQLQGVSVAAATKRTYCIPMMLNPLSMTTPHRMIPAFSLSALQFKITLDTTASSVKTAAAAVPFVFDDIEMVCLMTELSPGAQAQIDQLTGGQYNILANSYINSQGNVAAAATQVTANLGVSVSSLERIIVVHRPELTVDAFASFSLGNRSTRNLSQFQFLINSENYPQRPIDVGDHGAEAFAEMLLADHSLVDFRKGCPIQNSFGVGALVQIPAADTAGIGTGALSGNFPGAAKTDAYMDDVGTGSSAGAVTLGAIPTASNIGTFLCACEFESGLSDGKSSHIYSGISTISSTVQYKGTYGAGGLATSLDFFSMYTLMISLDMKGSSVFAVSV